jgi:hypothetical protein
VGKFTNWYKQFQVFGPVSEVIRQRLRKDSGVGVEDLVQVSKIGKDKDIRSGRIIRSAIGVIGVTLGTFIEKCAKKTAYVCLRSDLLKDYMAEILLNRRQDGKQGKAGVCKGHFGVLLLTAWAESIHNSMKSKGSRNTSCMEEGAWNLVKLLTVGAVLVREFFVVNENVNRCTTKSTCAMRAGELP